MRHLQEQPCTFNLSTLSMKNPLNKKHISKQYQRSSLRPKSSDKFSNLSGCNLWANFDLAGSPAENARCLFFRYLHLPFRHCQGPHLNKSAAKQQSAVPAGKYSLAGGVFTPGLDDVTGHCRSAEIYK